MKKIAKISSNEGLYEEYVEKYFKETGLDENSIPNNKEEALKKFNEWLANTIMKEVS